MSRLKSFEGVLTQANSWMRDVKTKHHKSETDLSVTNNDNNENNKEMDNETSAMETSSDC